MASIVRGSSPTLSHLLQFPGDSDTVTSQNSVAVKSNWLWGGTHFQLCVKHAGEEVGLTADDEFVNPGFFVRYLYGEIRKL
ncbi:hypothetical protein BDBG_16888 [Blastomyces gilchristii SLH14081]|uniref:Uncharacterized protein n=1 Tax=Blastomyces gilchristii (strain SLH14081) TaxID=559298 RepID=A0A179UKN5_BLAGS|nr:uncharacterized protein BDBG_16888 [Blastomyces gilchristii SLH14081]OAT07717.1 hypothetical protein BDBG_16888 [Blastomyces gilchristii SLH14081]